MAINQSLIGKPDLIDHSQPLFVFDWHRIDEPEQPPNLKRWLERRDKCEKELKEKAAEPVAVCINLGDPMGGRGLYYTTGNANYCLKALNDMPNDPEVTYVPDQYEIRINEKIIQLVHTDVVDETTDAIVNATDARLQHSGGLSANIARKGGFQVQSESNSWCRQQARGDVVVGGYAVTKGGTLPCKYIIHTNGPEYRQKYKEYYISEKKAQDMLRVTVFNCLFAAKNLKIRSVAFPPISTGQKGFPLDECAKLMLETIIAWCKFPCNMSDTLCRKETGDIDLIKISIFDKSSFDSFTKRFD